MGGKVRNPKEYYKHWRGTHKNEIKQTNARYEMKVKNTPELKEKLRLRAKKWRLEHLTQSRDMVHRYYKTHREEILARLRGENQETKQRVLTHYGKDKCACVICGEYRLACLSIDHIDGTGYEHRKTTGNGIRFYNWIERNNYPQGYQTLCMNCQFIKRAEQRECRRM